MQSPHLPGVVQQLAVLSPLIGDGIRKYLRISLLILPFLMLLQYSFTLEICQCLFARLVMNLIKREDNDWKIPAPLHHLPGVNIEVNYGLELPHTHISHYNYNLSTTFNCSPNGCTDILCSCNKILYFKSKVLSRLNNLLNG